MFEWIKNLIMSKYLFTIGFVVLTGINSFALKVSVNTFQFKRAEKNYLDVNLRILANSLQFKEITNQNFQAYANVLITVQKIASDEIVAFEKYQLVSKPMSEKKDQLDLKRFSLQEGEYTLTINIKDDVDTTNKFQFLSNIRVNNESKISNIFLSNFVEKKEDSPLSRNGYYMEPYAFDIVDERQRNLQFYSEIYFPNQDVTKDVILSFTVNEGISPNDSGKVVMQKYMKAKQKDVIPIISGFDLNYLMTGDYHLKVAVIDAKKKELYSQYVSFINRNLPADIAQKRNFNQTYKNSFVENLDSAYVKYCLLSLAPLHNNDDAGLLNQIIKEGTLDQQKYFLFKYWKDNHPKTPQANFEYYMKIVKLVDDQFYNTVGHGFQTDRGHIYLKHGKPNKTIAVDDEANTPPYEIWYYHYLTTTHQSNVRFIFYSPQLNEEYALLHSNCYGERRNERWEVILYKNAVGEQIGQNFEATTMQQNFNRKARMLWDSQ